MPSPTTLHDIFMSTKPTRVEDSYTSLSLAVILRCGLVPSGQLLCADSEEALLRFHLSDAGLFATTADFVAPADEH